MYKDTVKVSKKALSMLDHIFTDRIMMLVQSESDMTLSKQLVLRQMKEDVELFIRTHPKSIFNIQTFDREVNLRISNTFLPEEEYDNEEITIYTIVIDESWDKLTYYQNSIDNLLIKIRP